MAGTCCYVACPRCWGLMWPVRWSSKPDCRVYRCQVCGYELEVCTEVKIVRSGV